MLPNRNKVDISVSQCPHRPQCEAPLAASSPGTVSSQRHGHRFPPITHSLYDADLSRPAARTQSFSEQEKELFQKYGKVPPQKNLLANKLKVRRFDSLSPPRLASLRPRRL